MLNRLPPLNAIKAFHAASRHLNFSRAAEELGVTQGAVSKQIHALEDYIGARLFERHANGLELTAEGQSLKNTTLPAFDMLIAGFSRFERREPRSQKIRISTLASFASSALAPRLDRLEAAFPDVEIEFLTSDRLIDHAKEEVDFSIRYGQGVAEDMVCEPISSADLIPVMHPDYDIGTTPVRLLQVFNVDEWQTWERERGDRLTRSNRKVIVQEFLVALNAVLNGQGVALLPELIVRDHLANGRLLRFGEPLRDWRYHYYIAMLPRAQRRRYVSAIIDWLKHDIADSYSA
ncbi:MAG: LysR substrate-binding domain-containing protein [Pseudomonadota bacterium]